MVTADPKFWRGSSVLLTGHTGFKGAWLALWLGRMGASITAIGLPPDQSPALWTEIAGATRLRSILGDLRDPAILQTALDPQPSIVIHMAAQALVGRGYRE